MRFHVTGKVSLDHIYTQPDPREYFGTLRELEYRIPQLAKPHFEMLIDEYRQSRDVAVPQVLDIGSSYGINGALLRCDTTMDALYDRYAGDDADELTRSALLARDRETVSARAGVEARFVGLDISRPALCYATEAGFLDDALPADFERNVPGSHERSILSGTDLVISTGCLGYVGAKTISRVVTAIGERRPWMAHFVLRMFPFEPIADCLAGFGYETTPVDRLFKQRRFISDEEQSQVLDTLSAMGIDSRGLEADGWFYAQPFVSRPREHSSSPVFDMAADTAPRFRRQQ